MSAAGWQRPWNGELAAEFAEVNNSKGYGLINYSAVSVCSAAKQKMEAILALENGTFYKGQAAGAEGEARGEVVFNTSMTGYQEVLTDPSYAGQIVTMTCAEIGNYGVSPDDVESRGRRSPGSSFATSRRWRATGARRDAPRLPRANNIVAISDIDTRALTSTAALVRSDARRDRDRR